jgi:hypothetical protein
VIRKNYFHNETSAAHWAFAGYRDAITEGPVGGYCLYEHNRFAFADSASGLALRTPHNILRFNMFYHNGLGGIQAVRSDTADCADSNHIYNNVFYRNGFQADYAGFSGGVYFCDWGYGDPIGNSVKNNIFYDNRGGAITTDAVTTPQVVENRYRDGRGTAQKGRGQDLSQRNLCCRYRTGKCALRKEDRNAAVGIEDYYRDVGSLLF